jgi:acid phosphatase type 7
MKKYAIIPILLLMIKYTSGQLPLNFGSTNWDYSYKQPVGGICTPPSDSPSGTSWTSPNYVKPAGEWTFATQTLPIGYATSSSNIYGGLAIASILPYGSDAANKPTTAYLRQTITLTTNPRSSYSSFTLKLKADDGARIYFNGTQVANHNLPSGSINPNTSASVVGTDISDYTFVIPNTFALHPSDPNKITITAEVHQSTASLIDNCTTLSSDMFFDMELTGTLGSMTPAITRGPYLQLPHPTGIQVRWRTNTPLVGRVCFGTSSGSLTTCVNDLNTVPSNDHIVSLTGLIPYTTYFYSAQHTTGTLVESSVNHKFRTPVTGTDFYDANKTTRIWVTGDASEEIPPGSKTPRQDEVLNGFKTYQAANPGSKDLDLWLLLGDNAYVNGTDSEYSTGFFDPYDDMNTAFPGVTNNHIMKQTPIMPCVGNHDYYAGGPIPGLSSSSPIETLNQLPSSSFTVVNSGGSANSNFRINKNNPFFDIFSLPSNGFASKYSTSTGASKKGYYSYNHNNIHFVCLDSYGFYDDYLIYGGLPTYPSTATANPQMSWLINDLANNTQKWTIMYWHHAPYTRGGGHFSDQTVGDEFILKGIREKLIEYLDAANYKIDLVLNGHSHSYERSRLLKGHHSDESTFTGSVHNNNAAANANHNGKFTSAALECPYIKNTSSATNEGIVYVVTGSAGQLQKTNTPTTGIGPNIGHLALNGATFSSSPAPGITSRGTIQEEKGGSFYIEVTDNRLDAKFIEETTGAVTDKFTIFKDVNPAAVTVRNIMPGLDSDPSNILLNAGLHFGDFVSLSGPTISGTQGFGSGLFGYITNVVTPQIGPLYTISDATGCLTEKVRFHFTPDCWPLSTGVTINNLFDSPVIEHIRSAGTVTAKNTVMPNTKVIFEAVKSINLEFQPPAPSVNLFEVKNKTGANQYFIARPISSCP